MIDRTNGSDEGWSGTSYAMGDVGDMGYVLESEDLIFDVWVRVAGTGLPSEAVIEIEEKARADTFVVQSSVGLDSDECRRIAQALLAAAFHLDRQTLPREEPETVANG